MASRLPCVLNGLDQYAMHFFLSFSVLKNKQTTKNLTATRFIQKLYHRVTAYLRLLTRLCLLFLMFFQVSSWAWQHSNGMGVCKTDRNTKGKGGGGGN